MPSDDEDVRKVSNLVGSCFEDPDDGTCGFTGYGEDGDGARMLLYKLPDGEGVYGAVEEVHAWVLVHALGRPTRGSAGKINVGLYLSIAPLWYCACTTPRYCTAPQRTTTPHRYGNGPRGGPYFTKGRTGPCGLIGAASVDYFWPKRGHLGGPEKNRKY
jgi:hypothetical protein